MNKLTIFRKVTFGILFALFGVVSSVNAQSSLTGSGTSASPYLITSADDWDVFAGNSAYWASGVCVRLDANITVSNMVGTSSPKYQGTFDGNWHTLTFNKGTEAVDGQFNEDYCAPFRYINGATIKNLTVQGTIISKKKFVGGFVGSATGKCYITNCTSSIHIKCDYIDSGDGDCTHGGFIGQEDVSDSDMIFTNCLFDGWIKDTRSDAEKTAIKCAGFIGWANGKVHYTSCYMVGEIAIKGYVANFHRNGTNTITSNDCYKYDIRCLTDYTDYDDNQHGPEGIYLTQKLKNVTHISKQYIADNKEYYAPCTVIGGLDYIEYDSEHPVELTPEVYYFGKKLAAITDYTYNIKMKVGNDTIDKTKIQDAGDYIVTITGTNSVYFGSDVVCFSIIPVGKRWSDMQSKINDSTTIKLTHDFVATSKDANALTINKDITIYLNGHSINRNLSEARENGRVIEIASGKTVTIIGPGTITGGYKVAKNTSTNPSQNDGGGIYNMGNLTLTNVTVTGNRSIKITSGDESATGRGGGIYCGNSGSFTMTGGSIYDNVAEGGGGGIFVDRTPSMTMKDVSISSNTTRDKGAGMRLAVPDGITYSIENCTFLMNSATDKKNSEGGAIYFLGNNKTTSILNLNKCSFGYNSAYAKGGAIFSYKGTINATDCDMYDNLAYDAVGVIDEESKGGSVYIQNLTGGSVFTMDGGSITTSGALYQGGAVFVQSGATMNVQGDVVIQGCSVYEGENNIDNNLYLDGTNVIHITGPLGPNALIYVSNSGSSSNVVSDPYGYASVANFQLDNSHQRLRYDAVNHRYVVYTANLWDKPADWPSGSSIDVSGNCVIAHEIIIPKGVTAAPTSITINSGGSIVVEEGGQLVYGTSIPVTLKNNIDGAISETTGWYTISSAVHDYVGEEHKDFETIANVGYMCQDPYDLFAYDEAASYWRNQKKDEEQGVAGFTTLELGRGYIYRNGKKVEHSYSGYSNVSDTYYTLSCAATNKLKGFNLVGNPYTKNITLMNTTLVDDDNNPVTQLTGFYRLTNSGSWGAEITSTSEPIAVNEGILIQITEEAKKIKFSQTPREAKRDNPNSITFTVENSEYSDVAYAWFGEGLGLNKISHRNENIPMLYIKKGEKDYAIATMSDETKEFNLSFKAKTTGRYTLSVQLEGDFSYIHLYDKLTHVDVDMLTEKEYTFIGSKSDDDNRFIVKLSPSTGSDTDSEIFAYQSGNNIVVNGKGELQVFDVMGRLMMKQNVNGMEMVEKPSRTGVYIFRLEGKTQKIVVR